MQGYMHQLLLCIIILINYDLERLYFEGDTPVHCLKARVKERGSLKPNAVEM